MRNIQTAHEVKVLQKALAILEELSESETGVGIVKLAQISRLPPTTTHRILRTLLQAGYIRQDESKKYGLGMKVVRLARSFLNGQDLKKLGTPYLEELRNKTGETAHLLVKEGDDVLCMENVESGNNMKVTLPVGSRSPLYCTAAGKLFLAEFDEQELSSYLARTETRRFTSQTLTTHKELKKEKAKIQRQGYASDNEEYAVGVKCVAAPVRDISKGIIGALGISGPSARIANKRLEEFAGIVVSAARGLSEVISNIDSKAKQSDRRQR